MVLWPAALHFGKSLNMSREIFQCRPDPSGPVPFRCFCYLSVDDPDSKDAARNSPAERRSRASFGALFFLLTTPLSVLPPYVLVERVWLSGDHGSPNERTGIVFHGDQTKMNLTVMRRTQFEMYWEQPPRSSRIA